MKERELLKKHLKGRRVRGRMKEGGDLREACLNAIREAYILGSESRLEKPPVPNDISENQLMMFDDGE